MKHEKNEGNKEKKNFPVFLFIVGIMVLIPLLVLGFLGFVPIVSDIMGTNRPRDLGVKYTDADYLSARSKTGVELVALPEDTPLEQSIQMTGKKPVTTAFTDEELTALANRRKWKYYPVKDVQIKVNEDGTAEASARLLTGRLLNYGKATGVPEYYMTNVFDKVGLIPNPPVYIKGKATVVNGEITGKVEKLEIGRIEVPKTFVEENNGKLVEFLEGGIKRTPGLTVKSLDFNSGKMNFDGTLPQKEATVNNG
jgi:hypothetical protein